MTGGSSCADQFGWPEMVREVAAIYNSLPPGRACRNRHLGWKLRRSGRDQSSLVRNTDYRPLGHATRTIGTGDRRLRSTKTSSSFSGVAKMCRTTARRTRHSIITNVSAWAKRTLRFTYAGAWSSTFRRSGGIPTTGINGSSLFRRLSFDSAHILGRKADRWCELTFHNRGNRSLGAPLAHIEGSTHLGPRKPVTT